MIQPGTVFVSAITLVILLLRALLTGGLLP